MKKLLIVGIALFLIVIAGNASAYSADGLCNTLTPPTGTEVTCTINTARTSTSGTCATSSTCRITQTQMNGFWTWLAANRSTTTKVTWVISNVEVNFADTDITFSKNGTFPSASFQWDIKATRTTADASIDNTPGTNRKLTFGGDVTNIILDGAGNNNGARIVSEASGGVYINIAGGLTLQNHGEMSEVKSISAKTMSMTASSYISNLDGAVTISGTAGTDSLTMTDSQLRFTTASQLTVTNGRANISGRFSDGSTDSSIRSASSITVGEKLSLQNGAYIYNTNGNITVNGVAGTDSLTMTDSQMDFANAISSIIVKNGNMHVTGLYGSKAIYFAGSIDVQNGNLTMERGSATGRPYSLSKGGPGKIHASGDIAFTDVQVDGYDSDGSGQGFGGITSDNGNITVTSTTAYNCDHPIIRTVKGPIKAPNGRITFTGTGITDCLMGNYSITGLAAKNIEINNAKVADITFDNGHPEADGYGSLTATELIKMSNADLSVNSWKYDIRNITANALEMKNSKVVVRKNVTVTQYADLRNSYIDFEDTDASADGEPKSTALKLEITNPTAGNPDTTTTVNGSKITGAAFYMEGRNNGKGLYIGSGSPFSLKNNGDSAHGIYFKGAGTNGAIISDSGQALTITSCYFDVEGLFETFSGGGSLITGSSSDQGKVNMTTNLTWSRHDCASGGGSCTTSLINPDSYQSATTPWVPLEVTFNITQSGLSGVPTGLCGTGGVFSYTGSGASFVGKCTYSASITGNKQISTNFQTTGCTPVQTLVCEDCGAAHPIVPTILYVSAFVTNTAGIPIASGTFTVTNLGLVAGETCIALPYSKPITNGKIQDTISCAGMKVGTEHTAQVTISDGTNSDSINVIYKT